jgi:hypothetical protein
MRREMLALDKLTICELHDKCIFMGVSVTTHRVPSVSQSRSAVSDSVCSHTQIPKEEADKCLNTVSDGRSHMLLIDLIVSAATAELSPSISA